MKTASFSAAYLSDVADVIDVPNPAQRKPKRPTPIPAPLVPLQKTLFIQKTLSKNVFKKLFF